MEGNIIMDRDFKRSIILDNYQNANKKYVSDGEEFTKINTRNVSCIDNLDIYIDMKDNIIKDISFEGEACVISTSSTNIMINLLKEKTIDEALEIIKNYDNMIKEKDYDKDLIGEAIVYDDIYKQPNRIKCATLSWDGLYKELLKYRKSNRHKLILII